MVWIVYYFGPVMSMSGCLSFAYLRNHTADFHQICMRVVARSSSGGVAIRYVLLDDVTFSHNGIYTVHCV